MFIILWDVKEPSTLVVKGRARSSRCCGMSSVVYHGWEGKKKGPQKLAQRGVDCSRSRSARSVIDVIGESLKVHAPINVQTLYILLHFQIVYLPTQNV